MGQLETDFLYLENESFAKQKHRSSDHITTFVLFFSFYVFNVFFCFFRSLQMD